MSWISDDHPFALAENDAKPQDDLANLGLFSVIRSDQPESAIANLPDFLRLPPRVQEIVGRHGSNRRPPALDISHADRVRTYYPKDAPGVRPFTDNMLRVGVLSVFAAAGAPGAGRKAFDLVVEVRCERLDQWNSGTLIGERAPVGSSFRAGDATPRSAIPSRPMGT